MENEKGLAKCSYNMHAAIVVKPGSIKPGSVKPGSVKPGGEDNFDPQLRLHTTRS